MATLSELATDERTAPIVLSLLVEPNDPVTGHIQARFGAVEMLRLAERDGAVVGLSAVVGPVRAATRCDYLRDRHRDR